MGDTQSKDNQLVISDGVDDAVTADAKAPQIGVTLERTSAVRPRVVGEVGNGSKDSSSDRVVELLEFL
jgi:hypothetical protein